MLKERSLDVSDLYKVYICDKCGLIVKADIKEGIYECGSCNNNTEISEVHIPYAYKLLTQELMAMNIAPRMIVN
jgi:DNA-directed RNA polymerase II subunit RPB2